MTSSTTTLNSGRAPSGLRSAGIRTAPADRMAHAGLLLLTALLVVGLLAPLAALLSHAFAPGQNGEGAGFARFIQYFQSPALLRSLWNSIWVSLLVTVFVVPLAFGFAYAITRSGIRGKGVLRSISLLPLLAPSLLSAISLIYWFGNQGVFKGTVQALGFDSIYGAPGIVLAQCFATFPHALMIMVTALAVGDQRLYEAATALGASRTRQFLTVTLPAARYGVVSAALVVFTLVITDFGIPKVIGGNFNMLATDVFKLVIGQQDFQRGAVVALLLLLPAVITYLIDRQVQKKQTSVLTARAVVLQPTRHAATDRTCAVLAWGMAALMLAMFGMAIFASLVQFWPYQLGLTLSHYTSGLVDAGVDTAIFNSLTMAVSAAIAGPVVVFTGAYLLEKTKGMNAVRPVLRLLAMVPMAVPGLVLGLGYIFFFNAPGNPLNFLYQTMPLMVLCTVMHYYTTGHMTLVTALKAIDGEFEAVSASLKVPFYRTLFKVTLPMCLPALLEVSRYFFVAAMTTISAVVFLYSPDTRLGAVAILNLDEAGDMAAAAAMAVMIAAISCVVTVLYQVAGWWLTQRTQAWRKR
ncbi:putative 2-aminoethylphosphonate ABC transporter permease subunit [Comamonas odontotermitis]|uniref:putative 2-aminoethylphosphonate ABC transporter permease subunit n=1 Tax=Comamonas odontotermitis TaxID=379895 RepID=UPI0037521BAA